MSRLERVVWTVLYFAVGIAICITISSSLNDKLAPLLGGATAMLLLGSWRCFKRRIVRDLGWGARVIIIRLRTGLNPAVWYLIQRWVLTKRLHGLRVHFDRTSADRSAVRAEQLEKAMDLIRVVRPSRYARLLRLGPKLHVAEMRPGVGGGLLVGLNVIHIAEQLIDSYQPEAVACVLCHELLHAYIDSLGVRLTPWGETRFEFLAELEMRMWALRLSALNMMTPQIDLEIRWVIRGSWSHRWWLEDGTRISGARFVGDATLNRHRLGISV